MESVLDLGAGEGALVNEVYKVLKERSSYIVADIDTANCHKLKNNKDYKVYNIDCTSLYLSRRIHCKYGTIDLAVCNPPYGILENNKYYIKLLNDLDILNDVKSAASSILKDDPKLEKSEKRFIKKAVSDLFVIN